RLYAGRYDTPGTVAWRYGISVAEVARWNHVRENTRFRARATLVVYTRKALPQASESHLVAERRVEHERALRLAEARRKPVRHVQVAARRRAPAHAVRVAERRRVVRHVTRVARRSSRHLIRVAER
ncbi:MAG: LysM peptidoglycan-binding domain-containing protein, partial [Betaproteobacteria bacterium]|nr:LysM peptidoglycan-binding domain-containing protein [Betaproteobacteria bacterium]